MRQKALAQSGVLGGNATALKMKGWVHPKLKESGLQSGLLKSGHTRMGYLQLRFVCILYSPIMRNKGFISKLL